MSEKEMVLDDKTLHQRFWRKVSKKGDADCWEWQANLSAGRYGSIKVGGKYGKDLKAHRVVAIWQGWDIAGRVVMHICDNTKCVNPAHLLVGTQYDNIQDMLRKGRNNHASGERNVNARLSNNFVLTIRKHFAEGLTVSEVADKYNLPHLLIYNIAVRKTYKNIGIDIEYPIPSRTGYRRKSDVSDDVTAAEVRKYFRKAQSFVLTAEHFGINVSSISNIVRGRGKWDRVIHGEEPFTDEIRRKSIKQRKLTDNQVREIRSSTISRTELARKYGVSISLIFKVRNNEAYKWVK